LLVGAVLLALVAAGVAMVLSTCLGAWRAGEDRAALMQQAEAITDLLSQDLRASFLGRRGFFVSADEGDGTYSAEFTTVSRRLLRLLYLAEREATPSQNLSDLAQVIYFTEPAETEGAYTLYRCEICPPESEPLGEDGRDPEEAQRLSDQVTSFQLRFLESGEEASWLEEWDSAEGEASLPAVVEIAFTLSDGRRTFNALTRVPVVMAESASPEAGPGG
jgi:hypothetical protein